MLQPWAEDMLYFLSHFLIVAITLIFVSLAIILVIIGIKWLVELVIENFRKK